MNATDYCRGNIEGPYYDYSGRGVYGKQQVVASIAYLCCSPILMNAHVSDYCTDIRHPYDDPTPPDYFIDFLNLASTQEALGVNINYTQASSDYVFEGFASTGMLLHERGSFSGTLP